MRVIKTLTFAVLFFALLVTGLMAQNVRNLAVTIIEDNNEYIVFETTLVHTGAGTDDVSSQAIDMRGLTTVEGCITFTNVTVESARDVNLSVEGSNSNDSLNFVSFFTRLEWDDFSAGTAALELISPFEIYRASDVVVALTADSSIVIELDPAFRCRYFRFLSDGQPSNPVTAATTVQIKLNKIVPKFRYKPSYIVDTD